MSTDRFGVITTKKIKLPDTLNVDQSGIIYKDGTPFIHNFNYGNNGTVTTDGHNLFIGKNAGNFTMGSTATEIFHSSYNTFIGENAGKANTIGWFNTFVGMNSGQGNTSGFSNSFLGFLAGTSNTTGNNNSFFGSEAGQNITIGSYNCFIGKNAGANLADGTTPNETTSQSIYIGVDTKASADGVTNEIAIGYDTTGGGSNTVTIGNDDIVTTYLKGKVGIGVTPNTKLHIGGLTENDIITTDIGLDINPVENPSTPILTLLDEAGNIDTGTHYYRISYYTDVGETGLSDFATVTTDATHGKVQITLPTSPDYRVIGRKIYRSVADNYAYQVYFVADIPDNTTTIYIDNIADADLGTTNAYYRENTTSKFITQRGTGVLLAGLGLESNTIFGIDAGATIFAGTATTGANVLIGARAGRSLTNGGKNVAVGFRALVNATTGDGNHAIGWGALSEITTGSENIAIGKEAGLYGSGNWSNVYIGNRAGKGVSGNNNGGNVFIGIYSGQSITTGTRNILIGYRTGDNINSGQGNTIIGTEKDVPDPSGNDQLLIGTKNYDYIVGKDGNVGFGLSTSTFGTDAVKVIGIGLGTPPTTAPADMVQVWVEDLNGAGTCGLKMMDEGGNSFTIMGVTSSQGVSTGAGSILMNSANNADNTGWLEVTKDDGTTVYIPYWTTATP